MNIPHINIPNEKVSARTFNDLAYGSRHSLICLDPSERIAAGYPLLLEEYNLNTSEYTGNYALMWVSYKMKGEALKEGYCLIELQSIGPEYIYEGVDPKDIQRIVKAQIGSSKEEVE
jgi:hypothetical protein